VSAGRREIGINKTHLQNTHNLHYLKTYRKNLRNNLTPAEVVLWKYLKGKQLNGIKFRRQHSVGNYILDFYCTTHKLAIELDGAHHYTEAGIEYDQTRTLFLNENGITVLRFENKLVFEHLDAVLHEIKKHIAPLPS
jgi:very-short-patch-repair endonuclease